MQHHSQNSLDWFTFDSFPTDGLTHAVFGRNGGVSPEPYGSLNMSVSTGDSAENVRANRRRAFETVGLDPDRMATVWQVHGVETIAINAEPCDWDTKADALVTNQPNMPLWLRFADCVPVLMYDPKQHTVGIAHAGWRGTVAGVVRTTIESMTREYGTDPADVIAGIGPSIAAEHYEVGAEVAAEIEKAFPNPEGLVLHHLGPKAHADLWQTNARALREAGVNKIEIGGISTFGNTDLFFSHRAQGPVTGRFGAVISLA